MSWTARSLRRIGKRSTFFLVVSDATSGAFLRFFYLVSLYLVHYEYSASINTSSNRPCPCSNRSYKKQHAAQASQSLCHPTPTRSTRRRGMKKARVSRNWRLCSQDCSGDALPVCLDARLGKVGGGSRGRCVSQKTTTTGNEYDPDPEVVWQQSHKTNHFSTQPEARGEDTTRSILRTISYLLPSTWLPPRM